MTVRVERAFELAVPPARVWEFIADPAKRAQAISVVGEWEQDGDEFLWYLELPIPLVSQTVTVRTREVDRIEPERVKFVGRSRVLHVTGEHELTPIDGGTRVMNRFVVDGRLPGVERFFERKLDGELENLKTAIERDLGITVDSFES